MTHMRLLCPECDAVFHHHVNTSRFVRCTKTGCGWRGVPDDCEELVSSAYRETHRESRRQEIIKTALNLELEE